MAETSPRQPITVNIEWLSDCAGCHVAIVDLHEEIIKVLESLRIQHCPVLTDIKDYPKAKVGLVSGAIRTEHDRHAAEQMRESCDIIIALGTCAVHGGIAGAGTIYSRDEILDTVYRKAKTSLGNEPPTTDVSALEKSVTPLDEVIRVDYYLPGCPPHPSFIVGALVSLISGAQHKTSDEAVCGRCKRTMKKTNTAELQRFEQLLAEQDTCFLSQGILCMGSVTLDRCLSPCPVNNIPCSGCAGATMQLLMEPNRDIRTEIAERMSRLTAIDRTSIVKAIESSAKTHYSYTMASPMIGEKPTFLIEKWIASVEEEYE
jgi:F420-non-reducing hydrogenase small subunit